MHAHRPQLLGYVDALVELILRLLHLALEQVRDGQLPVAQRHALQILHTTTTIKISFDQVTYVSRDRYVQCLFEFGGSPRVLAQQTRANTSVVDRDELIVLVSLLRMLTVVHVAQIELLPLEKHDCKTIERQCTSNIVV